MTTTMMVMAMAMTMISQCHASFVGFGVAGNVFSMAVIASPEFLHEFRIMRILLAFLIVNTVIMCAGVYVTTDAYKLMGTDAIIHASHDIGKYYYSHSNVGHS